MTLLGFGQSQSGLSIHLLSYQCSGRDILHHQAKTPQFSMSPEAIHRQIFLPAATPAPFHLRVCTCRLLVTCFERKEIDSHLFN